MQQPLERCRHPAMTSPPSANWVDGVGRPRKSRKASVVGVWEGEGWGLKDLPIRRVQGWPKGVGSETRQVRSKSRHKVGSGAAKAGAPEKGSGTGKTEMGKMGEGSLV